MISDPESEAASERVRGIRAAWSSNALLWSGAARRLLEAGACPDVLLAFVALHLVVDRVRKFITGYGGVPGDPEARADVLGGAERIAELDAQLTAVRDAIRASWMGSGSEDRRTSSTCSRGRRR